MENTLTKFNTNDLSKDQLLANKISQLENFRNNLSHYYEDLSNENYIEILEQLNYSILTLQQQAENTKYERLDSLFLRFPVLINTLSKKTEKKVNFTYNCPSIRIEKVILDALYEPIIHLCEMFIFHGLETPEERIKSGKDEKASINLTAFYIDDELTIKLEDDGRGINYYGMLSNDITIQEIPVKFTNINSELKNLSGNMKVETRPGVGTKVFITIPIEKNTL